jgi:hypothetical protein
MEQDVDQLHKKAQQHAVTYGNIDGSYEEVNLESYIYQAEDFVRAGL